jgi:predicted TIM-barrel fold metal-dependent hydrolase
MTQHLADIKIIDVDTHVTEPPDLWTARLGQKWQEVAPKVVRDPRSGHERWTMGGRWLSDVATYAVAGWPEYPPSHPPTLHDADPGAWDPAKRLQWMDEHGVWAQVLYPNLIAFESSVFVDVDPGFAIECTRAYNDFLIDFSSIAPDRLIPIAMVPFWDIEVAVQEIERCAAAGHKGILFGNKYERIGYPAFTSEYWDPIMAAAQDAELSVNFHIAFSETKEGISEIASRRKITSREHAGSTVILQFGNAENISKIITSDVCHRFPRLKFVSVESGFGYVPYLLESLDWHYKNLGAKAQFPDRLLPSEYFMRQVYGTFWFEERTIPLLEHYADNFMFETDYPHPTSLSPGPASVARSAKEQVNVALSGLSDTAARKVLHDTAAAVYRLS